MTNYLSRKAAVLFMLLAVATVGVLAVSSADDSGWQASYWNNASLEGSPVLTRTERVIDHVYGESSPAPGTVNNDNFSARWTQTVNLQAGTYRFTMSSDDGSRVIVNGTKVLDQWYDHSLRTASAEMSLPGGDTQITVEYYERSHSAVASFKYELIKAQVNAPQQPVVAKPAPQQPAAVNPAPQQAAAAPAAPAPAAQVSSCANASFAASYFNNPDLIGNPVLNRTDPTVNFNWGEGAPANGVNADGFSARWTSNINLRQGSYLIALSGDDGLRLALNNNIRINDWFAQPLTTRTFNLDHPGGPINFRVEHFDNGGFTAVGLSCTRLGDYNGPPLQTVAQPAAPAPKPAAPTPAAQPVPASQPATAAPAAPAAPTASQNMARGVCQISNVYHLNLRAGPRLSSDVVGRVSYGELASLTGGRSGKYVQIVSPRGEEGWVNRYYCGNAELPAQQTATAASPAPVAPAAAAPATPVCNAVTVTTNALMVRGGPHISNLWYDIANGGDTLCLTGNRNEEASWVEVTTKNGVRGWVFCAYTTISYDQLYSLNPTQ